jgi:hypothetical protein
MVIRAVFCCLFFCTLYGTIANMDLDSDLTLGNVKDQHEALMQGAKDSKFEISTLSLIWRPAGLMMIPLMLTLFSIYLGFSWTVYFLYYLDTIDWIFTDNINGALSNWMCLPNGTATPILVLASTPTVWDASQFLDVTLGFSSFEFGIAKGIDIGWDLIVGRGGQIFLTIFSYRVLSATLLHSMETRSVTFYTYTTVGFNRSPLCYLGFATRSVERLQSRKRGSLHVHFRFSLSSRLSYVCKFSEPRRWACRFPILGLDHDRISD